MAADLSTLLTPIKVEGADAADFLHGQFTADLTGLAAGEVGVSAWCDPKGRVITTFMLARLHDAFWLLLPEDMQEAFIKRLNMFVLRARVGIAAVGPEQVPSELRGSGLDEGDPETALLRQGIPLLHPATSGLFLPQELNLDKLNAVSFSKGCYPGQEIIARLRYRGAVKRRLCHALTDNPARLQPGAALQSEGEARNIGAVINSVITARGQELLAVLDHPFSDTGRVFADGFPDRVVNSIRETIGAG